MMAKLLNSDIVVSGGPTDFEVLIYWLTPERKYIVKNSLCTHGNYAQHMIELVKNKLILVITENRNFIFYKYFKDR